MIVGKTPTVAIKRYTTVYDRFKGVDFSQDESLVDASRSPNAVNLISGDGFIPEKRPGVRTLHTISGNANGIFECVINSVKTKLAHYGTNIYSFTDSVKTLLYSGCTDGKSKAFYLNGKLYIQTGGEYLAYNGTTISAVEGRIPTILISRSPTGGGTVYEGINLICNKRTESFLGDTTNTTYQLSANNIEDVIKVEVMNSLGAWVTYTKVSGTPGANEYSVNLTTGRITFNEAKAPIVSGQDNVKVTYQKAVNGYANKIKKCTINALYGVGGDNRVFVSGNPDFPAYDWYSGLNDPEYFSDLNYSIVGTEETAIVGYAKYSNYLMIIKESSQVQGTIFKRTGTLQSNGDVLFTIQTGTSGLGAISKYSFANLIDEPLFLTNQGIYTIATINVLSDNVIRNRSFYINNALENEADLSNAVACEYKGYYMLFINNKVYLLDSKQASQVGNDYSYESYYWEGINANSVLSSTDGLYIGGNDKLYKLNDDLDELVRYNDDGNSIDAFWTTKNDDDNASWLYKTTLKKGCYVVIKPNIKTSAEVYCFVDSHSKQFIKEGQMRRFSFDNLSFENFTFETSRAPKEIYFKKKIKKYKRLSFMIRNNVVNEPFGIFAIVKTYTTGSYAKK